MAYQVIVPLVQVATNPGGVAVQLTKGAIVPENVTKVALDNLIELGYVEKIKPPKDKTADEGPKPGTVEFVLKEVGDDKAKAQAALDEEKAGQNRSTLVGPLEKILAG